MEGAAASLWAAFGVLLILEGLLPFISPGCWRRMFAQLMELRDGQLRFCALLSIVAGLLVLLAV